MSVPFNAELASYVQSSSLEPGDLAMLLMLSRRWDVPLDELADQFTKLVAEINRVRPHLPEE